MSIVQNYVDIVRKETKMFPVYPPNLRVRIGDFGVVDSGTFIVRGNISRLKTPISVAATTGPVGMHREFKSERTRKISIAAGANTSAGGLAAKARMELEFGSENSVYFNVAGCRHKRIANLGGLANEIVRRTRAGERWDNFRIVTALIESQNTTIVLGRESNSKVVLEAEGDVPTVNVADASLGLRMTYDSSASENWVTVKTTEANPLTPFCWFHQIDRGFLNLGSPTFDPTLEALPLSDDVGGGNVELVSADELDWREGWSMEGS